MQRKFREALVFALDKSEMTTADVSTEIQKVSVLNAPEISQHLYGSDFAFIMASFLQVSPQALAEKIAIYVHGFDVDAPGTGHINGSPNQDTIRDFQKELEMSFFLEDQTKEAYLKMLRNISRNIKKSKNEDVALIQSKPLTKENLLMTIALLADDDLDSKIYLENLEGKENIPLRIEQFKKDVKKIIAQHASEEINAPEKINILDFKREEVLKGAYDYSKRMPNSLKEICAGFVLELFSCRQIFAISVQRGRPEDWFLYIRDLVDRFYAFYNLPKYREMSSLVDEEFLFLGTLAKLLQRILEIIENFTQQLGTHAALILS